MAQPKSDHLPSGLSVQDVLFVIFKHKWKILFFTLLGLGAAAYVFFSHAPVYQSDAKLLVRYIVDRAAVDSVDNNSAGYSRANDGVMSAELEILTSWDLALEVAEAIGVDQLAPNVNGKRSDLTQAAQVVQEGLSVSASRGNVIFVSYKSTNQALATRVLQELVNRYFIKHLAVHRSAGAFDVVTQQTDQIRGRLTQTEEELKRLKDKAGITSLPDSTAAINAEIARDQAALDVAETARAEQVARLNELQASVNGQPDAKTPGKTPNATPPPPPADNATVQEYEALVIRLGQARQNELDLLGKYRPENQLVVSAHAQVEQLEHRRAALAARYPDLASRVAAAGTGMAAQGPDIMAERANLAALEARTATLKNQLQAALQHSQQLAALAPQITQLEREKEVEETNYRYYAASQDKARVDEMLDPTKIPNISMVQKPSVAFRMTGDLKKTLIQLAGGGLGLGLGLAFLIEMVLDQTIKRSSEFERRLRIPLLLSIPYLKNRLPARPALPLQNGSGNGNGEGAPGSRAIQVARRAKLSPWEPGHFIRPYAEAIRDRVGLYFELNDMTHKPKLVAVTGFSEGGGTSTIAGGIAAALSDMGEGKVLLVDMNVGRPELHPFFEGKPAHSLTAALQPTTQIAPAADNLYLATPFTAANDKQVQLTPKRLYELMPSLRASDFDYIVFDMPSLDESSLAVSMSSLMDKVLLVTEAEKCGASMVRRAYQELTAIRPNVSCVLNKTRSYGPSLIKADA